MARSYLLTCSLILIHVGLAQASQNGLQASFNAPVKVRPSFLEPKSQKAVTTNLHVQKVGGDEELEVVFSRREGVYCSENWDHDHVKDAQENNLDPKACMEQCKENPNCVGVSVTNAGWGDRPPWCHHCISRATKAHQNLDTYWMDELTPTEAKERNLREQLTNISRIEARLCEDPSEVSRSEFEKVKGQAKVREEHKVIHDKMQIEELQYHDKLSAEHDEALKEYNEKVVNLEKVTEEVDQGKATKDDYYKAKEEVEEAGDKAENLNAKLLRHNSLDVERKMLEEEQHRAEEEQAFIKRRQKALAKEGDELAKYQKDIKIRMKELDEQAEKEFWDNWLER